MLFSNPIIPGFNPDPTICRAGEEFFLVTSTFEYFPGLPVYRSRDLINWELIGNALDRDSQLPLQSAKSSCGLFAPTIRYNKGIFYLTCNNVTTGGNFIVTSKNPAGPWSEPVWLDDFGIDGSMFFDDDGKIYYSRASTDGGNGIMQAELDPVTLKLAAPFKKTWEYKGEWNEGPHLYKIKGKYYMMIASGGTESRHMEVIARGDSPWGPFEENPLNPILTHRDIPESPIQCTGHADLIDGPDGSWWAVFLGVRQYDGVSALGRETFLAPVTWKDGWPMIGDNHHAALQMEAPAFAKEFSSRTQTKQIFNSKALGPQWLHVRNPVRENYSLSARPGFLRIMGAAENMRDIAPQSFAGIRQGHFRMSASCALEFSPGADNEEAGISVRASDSHHCQIAVGRREGKNIIFARSIHNAHTVILAEIPFDGLKTVLEISGDETNYYFSWSAQGKSKQQIARAAAAGFAPEVVGGFTGAVIGMYATGNGKPCKAPADFEWFHYVPVL